MEIKRKFEMLTVTNRRYIIRQSAPHRSIVCARCGAAMLTAERAAGFFAINQRRVFQIIESGAIHYAETEAGALMICLRSLAAVLNIESDYTINAEIK